MLNELELTGRSRTHVVQLAEPRFAAQREAADAFLEMREAARRDGIDLQPYSSFRDFRTQLRIWNV
jgi:LAS superfamily LD-carboxypeptidase LdcB